MKMGNEEVEECHGSHHRLSHRLESSEAARSPSGVPCHVDGAMVLMLVLRGCRDGDDAAVEWAPVVSDVSRSETGCRIITPGVTRATVPTLAS
jgi:hypothetical protein